MTTLRPRPLLLLAALSVLGLCAPASVKAQPAGGEMRAGVDGVRLEWAALPDTPAARLSATVRASPYALWQPAGGWELRAGIRIDADAQRGGTSSFDRARAHLGDTYLRYRGGDTRITVGAQTVLWGRVDAIALIDRVSRADISRFALDDLPDRRLPQPALRWEQTIGELKLDAVLLPGFRGAYLPDRRSVWHPVDPRRGEIIGIVTSAPQAAFVQGARVRQDDGGSGGAGLRLTYTLEGAADVGLTLARTRQSLPYFEADPAAGTLTAIHPHVRFVGVDAELATDAATWRTELGWSANVPFTAPGGARVDRDLLEWVGAVEFFPGGEDTRVNLQLAARSVRGGAPIQQIRRMLALNGEIETEFAQGRWKAALRFNVGLNVHDVYLSPRISYLGWEPHTLYLAAHVFEGSRRSFGGFHRRHDLVAVGLETRF